MMLTGAILVAAAALFSQTVEWPASLILPPRPDEPDSSELSVRVEQSVYRNTLRGTNTLSWRVLDSLSYFWQSVNFSDLFERDGSVQNNGLIDMPGRFVWKRPFPAEMSLGMEWRPVAEYREYNNQKGMSSRLDAGPALYSGIFGFPFEVRGGLSALGWNERLGTRINAHDFDGFHSDQGIYGGLLLGEAGRPYFSIPLYLNGEVHGRSLGRSSVLAGEGAALLCHGFSSRDSIFFLAADSLDRGNPAGLTREGSELLYSIPALRMFHSAELSSGFKGRTRFGMVPGLAYSFSQLSSEYPSEFLRDRRNRLHAISLLLATDTTVIALGYRGGIRLEAEHEDKIFTRPRSSTPADTADSLLSRILKTNLKDYRGFRAIMSHRLDKHLDNGAGLNYTFEISRYSKKYPRDPDGPPNAVRGVDDNHWLEQRHRLWYDIIRQRTFDGSLHGEVLRNDQIFLAARYSGSNQTNRTYRVGGLFNLRPHESWNFTEELRAEASSRAYAFPQVHAFQYPPYSRAFSSSLTASFRRGQHQTIYLNWREFFHDDGYRFDPVYVDTAKMTDLTLIQHDAYYAVERWKTVHGVEAGFTVQVPDRLEFRGGITGEYTNDMTYGENSYIPSGYDGSILVSPYLDAQVYTRRGLAVDARLKPAFETRLSDVRGALRIYWDARVILGIRL